MIAKCCETKRHDWDDYLIQLLFAYRSVLQENTKESPSSCCNGRDPCIHSSTALSLMRSVYNMDSDDYRVDLVDSLAEA